MNRTYFNTGAPTIQLIEECSEVIHIICKGERFGWGCYHPDDPKRITNFSLALNEIEDLEKRIAGFKQWVAKTERGEKNNAKV